MAALLEDGAIESEEILFAYKKFQRWRSYMVLQVTQYSVELPLGSFAVLACNTGYRFRSGLVGGATLPNTPCEGHSLNKNRFHRTPPHPGVGP